MTERFHVQGATDATANVEINSRQEWRRASAANKKQNETKQSRAKQNKTKQSKAKQNKAKQVPEWDSPGTYQRMHHFRMPPKLDQSAGALPRLAPLAPPLLS
jgi:hypothetical protein